MIISIWVGWLLSEKFEIKTHRLYFFQKQNDNTHVVVIVAHIFLWFYVQ